MKKILFVGDINVDVILGGLASFPIPNREITCQSFDITIGSTAVISACAYASLGGTAAFLGLAGQDDYGDFMIAGLQDAGVDTSRIQRTSKLKTGVTVNLLHDHQRTQVTYPGTIEAFDGTGLEPENLQDISHVHFAGPYLQTSFRPRITGFLDLLKSIKITTSLDPQWDASEKWEHMNEWLPKLTYLFLNDDEARSITRTSSPADACVKLTGQTPQPIVKRGKDGVMIYHESVIHEIPSPDVNVVDTTGAGDNFDSAFLFAAIEKNMPLPDAGRFATAAAARSCMFLGGTTARSSHSDIIRFMEENK